VASAGKSEKYPLGKAEAMVRALVHCLFIFIFLLLLFYPLGKA
jgi:hypothetical protein